MVAHPDDESFGLDAVLDRFARGGTEVSVLCFTHSEASTLHCRPGEPADVRTAELAAAASLLAFSATELLGYPDAGLLAISATELPGCPDAGLAAVPVADLIAAVTETAKQARPTHLIAFDLGGVTGHPDHVRATEAALGAATALGLPVLGWTVPEAVARALNAEFGTAFIGRRDEEIDWTIRVDRKEQQAPIAAHGSQSSGNPVLQRRLHLLGNVEHLRRLT